MKLLDWMHRKFKQNNLEPLKEFASGSSCNCLARQPSQDDLQYYPKSNYYAKPSSKGQRDKQLRRSFACLETARGDDEHIEEPSHDLSELFHGFLAIGTLGSDAITTDPATPTFATSVQNIMEKETEATENELRLINDELEKVLIAEGLEDGCNDSSGRSSYVSIGRSSHGSTITLSGKPLEAAAPNNENEAVACPLQGYLFGSSVGLPETTTGKKEHRTSLGELFQKTKMADENNGPKCDRAEKQKEKEKEKEADKSGVHLMKKILKRRMLHSSSQHNTAAARGTIDSALADKKMHKILQMFHRKVHPESSVITSKSQNQLKYAAKGNITGEKCNKNGYRLPSREDIIIFPENVISTKSTNKTKSNMPEPTFGASDSNGNRECWIKSDADYLVLEL